MLIFLSIIELLFKNIFVSICNTFNTFYTVGSRCRGAYYLLYTYYNNTNIIFILLVFYTTFTTLLYDTLLTRGLIQNSQIQRFNY